MGCYPDLSNHLFGTHPIVRFGKSTTVLMESKNDKSTGLQQLLAEGRKILSYTQYDYQRHDLNLGEEFSRWEHAAADWLDAFYPGQGYSGDWIALEGKTLERHLQDIDEVGIKAVVRARMGWLARFGRLESDGSRSGSTGVHSNRVFVVHGRDEALRESVARLLEQIGLVPVILHEQPNKGRTVIEKFVDYSDVGFAVVLLTPDDRGGLAADAFQSFQPRARQNVILELGFFIGKLGRGNVCALYKEGVDVPSDYSGVLFLPVDSAGAWRFQLGREMREAGLQVDLNLLR